MTAIPEQGTAWAHDLVEVPADRTWWAKHKATVLVAGCRLALLAAVLIAWQLMPYLSRRADQRSVDDRAGHQLPGDQHGG